MFFYIKYNQVYYQRNKTCVDAQSVGISLSVFNILLFYNLVVYNIQYTIYTNIDIISLDLLSVSILTDVLVRNGVNI